MISSTIRKILTLCLCAALMTGLFAVGAGAATEPVAFNLCETTSSWSASVASDISGDRTQGEASVSFTSNLTAANGFFILAYLPETPINAGQNDTLEFDVYLSDPSAFATPAAGQIELSSSGQCDVREVCWSSGLFASRSAGWNHIALKFASGSYNSSTAEAFSPASINFFRIYVTNSPAASLTLKLDNIRFTKGNGELCPIDSSYKYTDPGLTREAPLLTAGDVDLNTKLNTTDALLALRNAVGKANLDSDRLTCADVNNSGAVDTTDALLILRRAVGSIPSFPCEKEAFSGAPETGVKGIHVVHPYFNTEEVITAITDVAAFGAAGDGVTDDTDAFNRAMAYAGVNGGGTVFVPVGRYVLKGSITIPNGVTLRGDSPYSGNPGAVTGTVLMLYYGRNSTSLAAAIRMQSGASLKRVSLWYPEQTADNIVPYPPTVRQEGHYGIALEDVVFVNSYYGIKMGPNTNSLQNLRGVCGTVLYRGLFLDYNLDICRLENMHFSADYWLQSGLGQHPDETTLRKYLYDNTTGFRIERVDWSYMADISADGCRYGMITSRCTEREALESPNGELYDFAFTNCKTGILLDSVNDIGFMFTKGVITAETAVETGANFTTSATFNDVDMTASGKYGVYIKQDGAITMQNCAIHMTGKTAAPVAAVYADSGAYAILSEVSFEGSGDHLVSTWTGSKAVNCMTADTLRIGAPAANVQVVFDPSLSIVTDEKERDYDRRVVTLPYDDNLIDCAAAPYNIQPGTDTDIGTALQQALNDMAAQGGGIVYLGGGTYHLNTPVTVPSGVELRGPTDNPQHSQIHSAVLYSTYGENLDETATALITLSPRSGLNGFKVHYNTQGSSTDDVKEYAYTLRGNGINNYIMNVDLCNPYYGLDMNTNRCDAHYVNGLTGAPLRIGIHAGGGSVLGLIRDVQFNPHYYADNPYRTQTASIDSVFAYQIRHAEGIIIGKTTSEINYHNFVLGVLSGLVVDDGADLFAISHGTDGGCNSLTLRGTPSGEITLVNSQLVCVGAPTEMTYVNVESSFTGTANMIQTNFWGIPTNAVHVRNGKVNLMQGTLLRSAGYGLWADGGSIRCSAMNFRQKDPTADINVASETSTVTVFANLYASGGITAGITTNIHGSDF